MGGGEELLWSKQAADFRRKGRNSLGGLIGRPFELMRLALKSDVLLMANEYQSNNCSGG